jgi:glycerol-3-phosphate cytidylyltransferase-like family protein
MARKVFVSGCFDLQAAARIGDLHVALGSDQTVYQLKGRLPVNSEQERLFMARNVACVFDAFISSGSGMLDFEPELRALMPDAFVVNADGNIPAKETLCRELGIEYIVLDRIPHENLPARSTTSLRTLDHMPYRIDLAGGWLDQPFVSGLHPGPVLTVSLEAGIAFNERSGMATSTRNRALELWGPKLPPGDPEKLAFVLFCYDNPPGTKQVSGSQDAIGIVVPGLVRAHYDGQYWPHQMDRVGDELTLQFVERGLYLVPLDPRQRGYNPLEGTKITADGALALADAANACWDAILARDIRAFGSAFRASFEAQVAMFPNMINETVKDIIDRHKDTALGWKLSGAGGGGYVIFVSEQPIKNAVRVNIRRAME